MNIGNIPLTCRVHLGHATLACEEYQELHVGDTILLDQEVTSPLILSIEGTSRFTVTPGLEGVRKAVRILEIL